MEIQTLNTGIKVPPLRAEGAGIYIHIPFCKQACHYCDFHFSTNLEKKTTMLAALQEELKIRKQEFAGELIHTIYFGGGTPSVLEIDEIDQILTTIQDHYKVSENPEITLEANPDDLSKEKLAQLASSAINRLSIGIQSFFEADLTFMNRAHNASEAQECIQWASKFFDNISIDLIYGLPNMTRERWLQNVEKALSFNVPHISSYALTVEPKTALAHFIKKGVVKPLDDAMAEEHFHLLVHTLEQSGYIHYEISNFGKPGYFSQNNTAYWLGKKYMGIGPSAHSFDGKQRSWNINNNAKYLASLSDGVLPKKVERLSKTDRYNEYVMTGLRTIWGVSLHQILKEFGQDYQKYLLEQAERHLGQDLLQIVEDKLFITKKGKFLSDGIASDLFMVKFN
ncbi:radical SAM family heme chaperone HemW [Flavobacteriaceae bacterium F89]|uniref:Heme chaperone HemW n=1 Tax=Cerina litoralis TaxID=2874477 RepID=A0AAE3JR75_9FLAO|nr:radical SAM family heme chaperone HemW [Cerina litoralis]MCG2462644.1 radical SAM family heme chaperone HemW [Cerina litoralis]